MSERSQAYLVDASIYIFRAYFSLPDRWHSPEGLPLNAVYGYSAFLLDFLRASSGLRYCAAAFDESLGSCFRNEIFPGYKASRELPDEALAFQLRTCREVTARLGLPSYGGPRYEADDYIAALSSLLRESGEPVTIVTRDKDLGQLLLGEGDRWWDFAADMSLDAAAFTDKFGVPPERFADYLALVGDPVDDIPGVQGVGAKTAARLLQHFQHLDDLENRMGEVSELGIRGAAKLQERLRQSWPQVMLSRRLTGLVDRIPDLTEVPAYTLVPSSLRDTEQYLRELGLGGPLSTRYRRFAEELDRA